MAIKFTVCEAYQGGFWLSVGQLAIEVFASRPEAESAAAMYNAAPKMLHALEIIAGQTPCIDNLMSDKDIARAALAEAKGEKS